MLLRHTTSVLALAVAFALGAAPTANGAGRVPASVPNTPAATEIGGGGPGLTCLGCVGAGVVGLATAGFGGLYATLMIGGAKAVALGGSVVTCAAACVAYFNEE